MNNMGLNCTDPHMHGFFSILHGFTYTQINWKKNPRISGTIQFKSMLFKGQLYTICGWLSLWVRIRGADYWTCASADFGVRVGPGISPSRIPRDDCIVIFKKKIQSHGWKIKRGHTEWSLCNAFPRQPGPPPPALSTAHGQAQPALVWTTWILGGAPLSEHVLELLPLNRCKTLYPVRRKKPHSNLNKDSLV